MSEPVKTESVLVLDNEFEVIKEISKYNTISFTVYDTQGKVDLDTGIIYDKELYLKADIKWDTCSHFWFGEEENMGTDEKPKMRSDGYLHLCGIEYMMKHTKLIEILYNMAKDHYDGRDDIFFSEFDEWNWDEVKDLK